MANPAIVLRAETVLLKTDAPDLLLARDQVGTAYLCSLISFDETGHRYLAVTISGSRLADLRSGRIDLRHALVSPEMGEHSVGRSFRLPSSAAIQAGLSAELSPAIPTAVALRLLGSEFAWLDFKQGDDALYLIVEPTAEVPDAWLPDEGFFLTDFEGEAVDEQVVRDAIGKNTAVVIFRADPPESRGLVPKIDAERLADVVRAFQTLVRHATNTSLAQLSDVRRTQVGSDAHRLFVYGFSPGSFNIHFESERPADLAGASVIGAAMDRIDDLIDLSDLRPDAALEGLRKNRGHVLAAYHSFMQLIAEQDAPFSYRWAQPSISKARGKSVSPAVAKAVCALLASVETLKVEPVSFIGTFTSVNTEREPLSWAVRDFHSRVRRGVLHESAQSLLDGIVIRTASYELNCEERLVRDGRGRVKPKLFLRSVSPPVIQTSD